MTELLYFLGRFHVLLLHLPIGILLLAVGLEVASRYSRFRHLAPALGVVWGLGAVTAIGTAVLGYLHALEGGFDGGAVNAHRVAGTTLAVVAAGTWVLRARFESVYARAWPLCGVAVVALLFTTGHFGGQLTHGDDYLTQIPRAAPKDPALADLYLDVVAPALRQRCGSCHNESKRKGGFSVASYASVMKGGEHGPAVVPGNLETSDLIRRISLSPDDEDFMPQDGKTPLSAEQVAAVRAWVEAGAPRSGVLAADALPRMRPQKTSAGLVTALTASAEAASPEPSAAAAVVPPPDAAAVDLLESTGFVVRAISAGSSLVQVDYTANRPINAADMDNLRKIGPQIHSLNLRNAGVTDDALEAVGIFENLARLRLEQNSISDAGLAHLRPLNKLEYLNLYSTKVTDAGLEKLGELRNLRELFLWQTAVTPAGIAAFQRAHANVAIEVGFDPKSFPEGPKVIPVVN